MLIAITVWGTLLAKDGRADSIRTQVQQVISVSAEDSPLRPLLERLSSISGVPIFLDRRIDPGRRVSLNAHDEPLEHSVAEIAAQAGAEVGRLEELLYVGPGATAKYLATQVAILHQSATSLPPSAARRWRHVAPLEWPRLASPLQLIEKLQSEVGQPIDLQDLVHHDLWAAGSLPPSTAITRLSVVLAGFNASFQFRPDGSVQVINFPDQPVLRRTYQLTPLQLANLVQLRSSLLDAQIDIQGQQATLTGRAEHHELLEVMRQMASPNKRASRPPSRATRPSNASQRYTLRVSQQPIRAVLEYLEKNAGVELEIPEGLEQPLAQRITLEVQQATLGELVEQILAPAGIQYQREGSRIVLLPR